jgi:hypothetical protein
MIPFDKLGETYIETWLSETARTIISGRAWGRGDTFWTASTMPTTNVPTLNAGVECSTIYPMDAQLMDTESTLRGIGSVLGTALRDSVAQRAQEPHRPLDFPTLQTPPPPMAHAFRGSIRGASTSIGLKRIQPRFFVDDVDLQHPKCILQEDANQFGRMSCHNASRPHHVGCAQ